MIPATENKVSQARAFLSMCNRSTLLSSAEIELLRSDYATLLERRNIKAPPPSWRKYGFKYGQSKDERMAALGLKQFDPNPTPEELQLSKSFGRSAKKTRAAEWRFRVGEHMELLNTRGWYPFFVTLTLDASALAKWNYSKAEFWKDGREWKLFRRKLAEISAKECGFPARYARSNEKHFLHFVGVLEHGKSRHHHHMHCLIWMKDCPAHWKIDPNRDLQLATRDECFPMRSLWKWSQQKKMCYFRFIGDPWSTRHGFKVPLHKDKKRPIKLHAASAAGVYVSKYLDKDDKEWNHRVKATHRLGLVTMINWIQALPRSTLLQLARRLTTYENASIVRSKCSAPLRLIRMLAKRQEFYNQWVSDQTLTDYLNPKEKPWLKMRASLETGIQPWLMPSRERFEWLQTVLPAETIEFCENLWYRVICQAGEQWPPLNNRPVQIMKGT